MKLLTLNCHSWQEDNQIEKIKYLAKIIKEKQYDVIALQEVSQKINSKLLQAMIKEDNFAQLLIEELNKRNKYSEYSLEESSINYSTSQIFNLITCYGAEGTTERLVVNGIVEEEKIR